MYLCIDAGIEQTLTCAVMQQCSRHLLAYRCNPRLARAVPHARDHMSDAISSSISSKSGSGTACTRGATANGALLNKCTALYIVLVHYCVLL